MLDDLLAQSAPPERQPPAPNLPKGWEPGVRWSNDTDTGSIVTDATTVEPDAAIWAELIADWGLDPGTLEVIDGSIELIGWDSPVKGTDMTIRLKRYKARLRRRVHADDTVDLDHLRRAAARRRPPKRTTPASVDRALVVTLADWQVGKGEGGGTPATVARITAAFDNLEARLGELKRVGRDPGVVYLVGIGDIVEQCSGHYASQAFTTDLNRREQMRVARRLILNVVDRLVDRGYRVALSAVAGNHGENRNGDGKAYTTPDDSDDLAVFEQVGEVLTANPDRYADVSVFLPTALSMTLDIAGVPVGFTHGHLARGGANPAAKVEKWWTGQVMGFQPVADARILVTGHYHHLLVVESTGRTHFQCPAMDGGSGWWTTSTGQSSPSGMLTFTVGADCGSRGWADMAVL
jgi:predicted phosphodiesterase